MPKKGGNISLTSYDDIFETDESRAESQLERVQQIRISELVPFKEHPFKVVDDEAMLRTTESIAQYGVLTPLIARPLEEGGYEIISGHRRAHAAEMAGLTEIPVLVRNMDNDAATVLMVDSNLQRENILPSERAFAYKMKLEAIKHQGERTDLSEGTTSSQLGMRLQALDIVGKESGDSRKSQKKENKEKPGHYDPVCIGGSLMKVIFDMDTGVDDSLALIYALNRPDYEIQGIGCVYGNVESWLAAENTMKILDLVNAPDIPVVIGANEPLTGKWGERVTHVHGENGLGNVELPESKSKPLDKEIEEFYFEMAQRLQGEMVLITLGPLTECALSGPIWTGLDHIADQN